MKTVDLTLIHACDIDPKLEIVPSVYAPPGNVYLMPNPPSQDAFRGHLKTIYQAEKEKAEWIRKYENAINGLNYWRERALEI